MKKYIEYLDFYNKELNSSPNLDTALEIGIKIYSEMINSELISVYLFDLHTFEPVLRKSTPENSQYKSTEILEKAINLGFIGDVMNSNEILINELDNTNYLILLPLITYKGALGFVLIYTGNKLLELDSNLELRINNFNYYFSLSIDNFNLVNDKKSFENKLDQLVAVQTQELLEKKEEISEKVEQLKSSLLMTLPHEVRTPLNQILGLTDYLKNSLEETDFNEMKEILEDVHISAVRLKRLFENYLYLSTLTINSYDIVELEKLQNSVIYSAESLLYETVTNLSYTYEINDKIEMNLVDSPLQISEEHFNKLIYELVDNAIKFNDKSIKIKVSSKIKENKYVIHIIDYGIGMPLEKLYMLDAYIQFDRLINEQQGSGLGLAIVNKIISIYKGQIKFKSKLGEYTNITIKLPIAEIDLDDI